MSDRKRRTLWDSIKKRVKKPIFKKGKKITGDLGDVHVVDLEEPGKKLMITALIGIETCKSTVLLKNVCHISASCLAGLAIMPRGVGWQILPYMG